MDGTPEHHEDGLTCEGAGQSLAWTFLDTEEVGGSDPPAPTQKPQVRSPRRIWRISDLSRGKGWGKVT